MTERLKAFDSWADVDYNSGLHNEDYIRLTRDALRKILPISTEVTPIGR